VSADRFVVIRFTLRGRRRIVRRGLTLDEAQAHCRSVEASSRTATSAQAVALTKRVGAWFDGYDEAGTR
jgi:hypothetical protein